MTSEVIIKDNQDYAFSVVRRLVGGDAEAYFESLYTIAMVWAECGSNKRIQQLVTNCLFGSYQRASENKAKLEAELVAVFGLKLEAVA